MSNKPHWFDVDREVLAKLIERREKREKNQRPRELIASAWDVGDLELQENKP